MLSQNQLKHLRSLSLKKYRLQYGQFLVEGEKMVDELLGQTRIDIAGVYGLSDWIGQHERHLHRISDRVVRISEIELSKISTLSTPNKVLAVAKLPQEACDFNLVAKDLCFYLDGIQDPGNLGAILRVADWFGIPAVFCSPDCVEAVSPKVVQASMGAVFRVHCWESSLEDILNAAPDIPVMGAVLDGENVYQSKLPQHGLLVIGNESRGISATAEALLTRRLSIPRHASGGAESLNASVAAGILASEFRR